MLERLALHPGGARPQHRGGGERHADHDRVDVPFGDQHQRHQGLDGEITSPRSEPRSGTAVEQAPGAAPGAARQQPRGEHGEQDDADGDERQVARVPVGDAVLARAAPRLSRALERPAAGAGGPFAGGGAAASSSAGACAARRRGRRRAAPSGRPGRRRPRARTTTGRRAPARRRAEQGRDDPTGAHHGEHPRAQVLEVGLADGGGHRHGDHAWQPGRPRTGRRRLPDGHAGRDTKR